MPRKSKVDGNKVCPNYGRSMWHDLRICAKCKIRKACHAARDIDLIKRPQNYLADPDNIDIALEQSPISAPRPDMTEKRYTLADMLHVVRSMAAMDDITLMYLDEIFEGGCGIFFADIAKKCGVTRQAVHKKIKHELQKFPELASVFYPAGRPRNGCSKQTFKEEAANE